MKSDRDPAARWGGTAVHLDPTTGERRAAYIPTDEGIVGGLPFRLCISVMGLVIAVLSVTGVVIWWKKRAARTRARQLKRHPSHTGR